MGVATSTTAQIIYTNRQLISLNLLHNSLIITGINNLKVANNVGLYGKCKVAANGAGMLLRKLFNNLQYSLTNELEFIT